MSTYVLKSKSNKRSLYGDLDSKFFYQDLNNYLIQNNMDEVLELDLDEILSIDFSFIKNVFVKAFSEEDYNLHSLILSNVNSDAIIYYLDKSFSDNGIAAYIKIDNELKSIGSNSCLLTDEFV